MTSPVVGEFLGTMMLILLGDGVVAGVLLKRSKAEGSGWMVITAGWAFAVMCGVFVSVACGSRDAHLNPAVTLGFAVRDASFVKVAPYFAAQLLGAIVGAILVWLHYLPHWKETPDAGAKLGVFCTAPAIPSIPANLICEIIGAATLVFGCLAIPSATNLSGQGWATGFGPLLVGLLVFAIGLSLGGPTGYAINPARDLGPRLAHAILPIAGKGGSDWSYAWIPIVGPIIGGLIGALVFHVLYRRNNPHCPPCHSSSLLMQERQACAPSFLITKAGLRRW